MSGAGVGPGDCEKLRCEPCADEDEYVVVKRMAGRQLKAPRMAKSRMSLPQWMIKSSDAKQRQGPPCPRGKKSDDSALKLPPLQPVLPGSASGSRSPSKDVQSAKRSTGVSPERKKKPLSLELERRRRLHPRLRWPRLARDQAPNGGLGIIEESPEAGAEIANEEDCGELASTYLTDADLTPDVIGPGSLFYTGKPVPIAPQWSAEEWGLDRLNTDPYSLNHISRNSGSSDAKTPRSLQQHNEKLALLSRARPHQELAVGHSATVHLPRLCGSLLDHRERARKGESPSQDRKYLIRQAPFSHIMARTTGGTGSSSSSSSLAKPKALTGMPGGEIPETEYLNFEGWGIDDAYVDALCKKAKLDKIKFMNFSDNRLTEQSMNFMIEAANGPWILQSLQLSKNRLQERGGRSMARLLETVRPPLRELDLSDNLLGDKGCEALCEVLCDKVSPHLIGLTLSQNEIGRGDHVGAALGDLVKGARSLEMLDLHWNLLHGVSAAALLDGVYENNCQLGGKLRRLNLAWNRLGMRCKDHHPHPTGGVGGEGGESGASSARLSSQQVSCSCGLCTACTRMVKMLASILQDGEMLFHLDLSYNGIGAADCTILGDGLRKNHTLFGLHLIGNEAQVDELGFVVPAGPASTFDSEEQQDRYNRYFENIPSKLRLDLTPMTVENQGKGGRMSALMSSRSSPVGSSPGSRKSTAPLAVRDELPGSFQQDAPPALGLFGGYRANPSLRNLAGHAGAFSVHPSPFSKEDVQMEKDWVEARTKAQQPLDFATPMCEDVRRNARCCWICENWVEQRVSYIPGWSGPENSTDEVTAVYAFFSIDGFARATKLTRVEEPFQRRMFDAERHGKMRQFGRQGLKGTPVMKTTQQLGRRPMPCLTEETGRIVRWTGSRMLPPTTVPIQVIFQVNDRMVTADDLPTKALLTKKAIRLHDIGEGSSVGGSVPPTAQSWHRGSRSDSKTDAVDAIPPPPGMAEVDTVNVMCVGLSAWEKFELGEATALVILEDPAKRGQINVVPRQLQEVAAPRPATAWSFEKSIFAQYTCDAASMAEQCFENDWKLSKLANMVKKSGKEEELCGFLKKHYFQLMAAHHHYAFFGYKSTKYPPGVLLIAFTDVLTDYGRTAAEASEDTRASIVGGRTGARQARGSMRRPNSSEMKRLTPPCTPGATLFNKDFATRDADTIFVASCVVEKEKRKGLMGMPDKGLARFQFLESFVRVAQRRFQDTGEKEDILEATKALWKLTSVGQDLYGLRQSLHKNLFVEECDIVYKEYHHMLEAVYLHYKELHCYPGRQGCGLSFGAWDQLLQDADVADYGLSLREIGAAFALGKEFRVDEYRSMRHMELSWAEFLVALGAVLVLMPDFDPDFLADTLADFFAEHISSAHQSRLDGAGQGAESDQGMSQVLNLVGRVFQDADDDHSGFLSIREFRRAMNQPKVKDEMKELGVQVEDLSTLFSKIDQDGSGEVTLDELCEAFMKMKLSMRGTDRCIAYFRKAFAEADSDGSGTLSMYEFKGLCTNPRVIKRLGALGVQVGEVDALFERMSLSGSARGNQVGSLEGQCLTADDMVAGLLAVRDSGLGESRGVNFLRQIFLEADADGTDSLSRVEVEKAFCTERVSLKLQKLQLKEPAWMDVFDALDADKNGSLSWHELSTGVCQMWKQAIDDEIHKEAKRHASTVSTKTMPTGSKESPSVAKVSFAAEMPKESGLSNSASASTVTPSPSVQSLAPAAP